MKNKTVVWKKLLSAALVGTFALSPILMNSANADSPHSAPALGYRGNDHRGDRREIRTFTGIVTRMESHSESHSKFKIRVDGREYNVSLSQRAPIHLNRGDRVRVYGYLLGKNDIRDATAIILSNRPGNNHPGQRYQTFVGVVTKVKSDSEFDMRFEGKTYNVYLNGQVPHRLNRNDRVNVYGYRYGNNDIRNASVRILRNR
ncbi:MAG: hypothetical protein ABI210_05060 [Abditibacteriaceae bacterium]